ncbi:MAG: hypothetical protein MUP66_02000 [Candidatus Nanohaloarchaeota archaeon QJJ-5]|nr:hypothetical protein [Candidatus Nanohaloarchaeota archaeon QJJ-5]
MAMRQGQFIMLGAVLLAGMIFGVVSIASTNTDTSIDTSPQRFLENIQTEYPRIVTNAIDRSYDLDTIERETQIFMRYTTFAERQRGLRSDHYTMVGLKTDDGYAISVGNFYDSSLEDITVEIGEETQQVPTLEPNSFYQFSVTPTTNSVTVTLEAEQNHTFRSDGNTFSLIHSYTETQDAVWRNTQINN